MNPAVFTCVLPLCFWELCDPVFISDVLKLLNELPLCGLCTLIATLVSDFQTQELEELISIGFKPSVSCTLSAT